MPTFTVQINVNVPGLGDRTFTVPGIIAADACAAIATAKQGVIITALAVQQTAP